MKKENTTVFSSKEEYTVFTDKWKKFLANGRAKTIKDKDGLRYSPLTSEFHLFYSLARGKGVTGFKDGSEGLIYAKHVLRYQHAIDERLKSVFGDTINQDIITKVQLRL